MAYRLVYKRLLPPRNRGRLTGKPDTIRTRRRLLGDWNFHSDLADFQRMPVEDATPNEFCFKLALMGRLHHTIFSTQGTALRDDVV